MYVFFPILADTKLAASQHYPLGQEVDKARYSTLLCLVEHRVTTFLSLHENAQWAHGCDHPVVLSVELSLCKSLVEAVIGTIASGNSD